MNSNSIITRKLGLPSEDIYVLPKSAYDMLPNDHDEVHDQIRGVLNHIANPRFWVCRTPQKGNIYP